MEGNPLGLPPRCEAAVARYGEKGSTERVVLARFPDASSAERGVASLVRGRLAEGAGPGVPYLKNGKWSCAASSGSIAVVVLGCAGEAAAAARLSEAEKRLGEVKP